MRHLTSKNCSILDPCSVVSHLKGVGSGSLLSLVWKCSVKVTHSLMPPLSHSLTLFSSTLDCNLTARFSFLSLSLSFIFYYYYYYFFYCYYYFFNSQTNKAFFEYDGDSDFDFIFDLFIFATFIH